MIFASCRSSAGLQLWDPNRSFVVGIGRCQLLTGENAVRGLPQTCRWLLLTVVAVLLPNPVPALAFDKPEIERLIPQLGSPNFAKREVAAKRLDAIGEPALDSLRKAAAHTKDAEIRRRAESLIKAIEGRIYTEVRRFEGHTAR